MDKAVVAWCKKTHERARAPLEWATTQNNLGNAIFRLSERESGTVRLEEAVAAFREALQERTRARAPLDWAMTQNNLATALETLGERESGTARLEEAISAYRKALKEKTARARRSYGPTVRTPLATRSERSASGRAVRRGWRRPFPHIAKP